MKMRTPYGFEHASRWRAAVIVPLLALLAPVWAVGVLLECGGQPLLAIVARDVVERLMAWAGFEGP